MNKKPRLEYVMRKVTIDLQNIGSFVRISEKRKIRWGKVETLKRNLLNGKHFQAPIVINRKGKKDDLTDGNHRVLSIEEALKEDPTLKVEVWIAYYDNLNPDQEREVFQTWNIGTAQSSDDFLKVYWETIPLRKEIEKIPTSIYLSDNAIKVKLLLGSQINAKKEKPFEGGYSAGNVATINDFRNLTLDDIKKVKAFLKDFEQIFGQFNGKFAFWKGTAVNAFYRVWYDNLSIPRHVFIKHFKRVFLGQTQQIWVERSKAGGREASKLFRDLSLNALNSARGRAGHTFV